MKRKKKRENYRYSGVGQDKNSCSWITKPLFKHGSLQGTIKLVLTWKDFVGGAEEAGKLLGNQNVPISIKGTQAASCLDFPSVNTVYISYVW